MNAFDRRHPKCPGRRRGLTLALALFVAACASPPAAPPRGAPGEAKAPAASGPLAEAEASVAQAHGLGRSGFRLLESNHDGLTWRLALVDSAQQSLDLQYYTWWGDEGGNLLMKRVVEAADRGVKVRLILDDLSTVLVDETHPKVRDRAAALIDAHPNIEIRLFNAWHDRSSLFSRGVEGLAQMERINHRMHAKLMVADNRAAIVGGRNIGNEYLGLSPDFNFRDLDVLGFGPVARQASAVFDTFWNSDWVVPIRALGIDTGSDTLKAEGAPIVRELREAPALQGLAVERQAWRGELAQAVPQMHGGTSRMHTDSPDPGQLTHHMPAAIRKLVGSAQREVLVANAYIIPDEATIAELRSLVTSGVTVRVLTNSLASHDVPAVNSHYKQWRKPLLEAGVELYEVRHDASTKPLLADTPPTVSTFMGFHVKALVIDRERVFIGSMNLDPRSAAINSEMGVVVDSASLAQALAASVERDMLPANAWRVTLAADGSVRWTAGERVLDTQPARNTWQRVEDIIFMAFPRDLY
jgi:putative cardiolipin synthase